MKIYDKLYINGSWVSPTSNEYADIINPANDQVCARTPLANEQDVVTAIESARAAFPAWSQTPASQRADFINAAADEMERRSEEFIAVISQTMGCPLHLTDDLQEMHIVSVFVDPQTRSPVVVLRDESHETTIPIWVGIVEASAIASKLQDIEVPRPLTHDLFGQVI